MCLERSSQSLFASREFNHKRDVAQLSLNSTRFWLRISMDRSLMTIRFVTVQRETSFISLHLEYVSCRHVIWSNFIGN